MIRFDDVAVRHPGAAAEAVRGVSFRAMPGRLTAIVGPNGSGKSSCVRALLRRVPLARGRITVGDADLGALDQRRLARTVAVVPQRESPAFPLRVAEFVALGRFAHGAAFGAADAVVDEAMRRADVATLAARPVDGLSGGEWQRVRIARALAQDAPALVLDEPTTFLDIAHEMAVFELLRALADEGRAVVLVSHQLNLVARFADRVVLFHDGRVAADGAPDDVMRASVLEPVYAWPLVVVRDPAVGAPALLPLRAPDRGGRR